MGARLPAACSGMNRPASLSSNVMARFSALPRPMTKRMSCSCSSASHAITPHLRPLRATCFTAASTQLPAHTHLHCCRLHTTSVHLAASSCCTHLQQRLWLPGWQAQGPGWLHSWRLPPFPAQPHLGLPQRAPAAAPAAPSPVPAPLGLEAELLAGPRGG